MLMVKLLILGLIVYSGFLYLKKREPVAVPQKTSLEILKERYARGEITSEEYREMLNHI